MNDLISICIPTYKRPLLLEEAVRSCLSQSYQSFEIVISDDSPDDESERVVACLRENCSHDIRYFRNEVPLQQAANVNHLFDQARGDRLVLLHDDDLLLPNALSDLARCWEARPDLGVAYGKQYLMTNEGEVLPAADELNAQFLRTARQESKVLSALEAALVQQFPNDGYMIKSEVARRVRYRDQNEVGTTRWCDYDFGIHLAQAGTSFFYLDKYTAKYRLTKEAISKSGNPTYMFAVIEQIRVKSSESWAKNRALQRLAPIVAPNYALNGQRTKALRVYFSKYYGVKRKFTKGGIFCLLLILMPFNKPFARWIKSR